MLVLTRRKYESIVVDGPAVITLVEIRGDKVRVGIKAGPGVIVDREEVYKRRMALVGPKPERQPAA